MFLLYMNPILIAAAVVPAVFLLIRVYRTDRLEPEPSGLLLSLILRGVFATVIAMVLEELCSALLGCPCAHDHIIYRRLSAGAQRGTSWQQLPSSLPN